MAQNQTRRIKPADLAADRAALIAIQALSDYTPANPAYNAPALATLGATLEAAQQAELHAQNALAAARDAAVAAEWALHNAILGAKTQVLAQYGADSDAIQSLGLKKKSERKRPSGRTAKRST